MSNVEFTARRTSVCCECENPIASAEERARLASMRDELLESDWAYWHDDPAVEYLNRLLGDAFPPFVPEHMRDSK